jgi:hypothetical protein
MAANSGRARSKSAWLPPAMMVSVPATAMGSPPETGASKNRMPRLARAAAISRESVGAPEVMSMTRVPGAAAERMPPSPRHSSRTWGELGSMVMISLHAAASSAGEAAASAPSAASSRALAGVRL